MTRLLQQFILALGLVGVVFLAGCGDEAGRYQVSGSVTYKGQPVPKGYLTFTPDTTKGNSGPGGGAMIVNGKYRTERGKGAVGGPHIVRIVGFDGQATTMSGEELLDGKPLFTPHELAVDLPKKNHTQDFEVPAPGR